MIALDELIAPHLAFSDSQIAEILNTPSVEQVDTQRWTWAGLAIRFGPELVGVLDETLKALPGYDWVRLLLAGSGVDFSLSTTQDALESLRIVDGISGHVDSLKAVGRWTVSPWNAAGHTGEVTSEQVGAARELLRDRQWVQYVINEILSPSSLSNSERKERLIALLENGLPGS